MVSTLRQIGRTIMASNEHMPNKSLGQHWLSDETILNEIADSVSIQPDDTVLEIGPGLGTLTTVLADKANKVIAVEFDEELARNLVRVVQKQQSNIEVINADFLQFDLSRLPKGYKVVANIPYYITAKIVQKLLQAKNKPTEIALLVQKEVAERLAATPGDMSILSISAQIYADLTLGVMVPARFFTPPPKVDSEVIIMKVRDEPLFENWDEKTFFKVVKAGFSARRKKLRSSLSGGLGISKAEAEAILRQANIDPNLRAQDLSLDDWQRAATAASSKD